MRSDRKSSPDSLAGCLLLAHPSLRDPNFRRTVVLMTAHGPDGAMGVVINRPMEKLLADIGGDFALGPLAGVSVYQGGPVQTEQLILAGWKAQLHGFQLHMGIDPEKAAGLFGEPDTHIRAFLGYSGWSAGQLEAELKADAWVVADAPTDLFSQPADPALWRTLLAREGPEWLLLADEPEDPEDN